MSTINIWFTHQVHKNWIWFEIETVCNIQRLYLLYAFGMQCDETRILLCLAAVLHWIEYKMSHSSGTDCVFDTFRWLYYMSYAFHRWISHRWSIVGHYAFRFLLLFECEWLETTPFHAEIHGEWNILLEKKKCLQYYTLITYSVDSKIVHRTRKAI